MQGCALALRDGVGSIRIHHQVEWLAQLDQAIHQTLGSLVVYVIIAGSVDDQEVAFEAFGEIDRGTAQTGRCRSIRRRAPPGRVSRSGS